MTVLRPPTDADWDAVLTAADAAVPFDPRANREWARNRRAFDATGGVRRHYVAVDGEQTIGYGAIELATAGATRARLFVTTAPSLLDSVGDLLYRRLMADADELGVAVAWSREYDLDEPLLRFLQERGFVEVERARSPDGNFEYVVLEHSVRAPRSKTDGSSAPGPLAL